MQKLLIIDTNGLAHRAYHAFPKALATSKGELTNAVYGFSSLLLQSLKLFKPDYVICAQDSPGKTFRHELYDKYKATRPKMDPELVEQIPKISEIIESFNIPRLALPGYEADDIIGYLTGKPELSDYEIIIVTGDKDLMQLINDRVKVYLTGGAFSSSVLYDSPKAYTKFGFEPKYLVDFKAIRGDPSDNIPGAKGIGEKTATDLIAKYNTIENLYKNLGELKDKLKTILEKQKDTVFLSRELAKIDCNLSGKLGLNLDDSEYRDIDFNNGRRVFEKYEFRTLISRLGGIQNARNITRGGNAEVLHNTFNSYEIKTEENLRDFQRRLENSGSCSIICSKLDSSIFSVPDSIYFGLPGNVYKVPAGFFTSKFILEIEAVLKKLDLIAYDSKELVHCFINLGFRNIDFIKNDLSLAAYLVERGRRQKSLQDMALSYLGINIEQQKQINLFEDKTFYTQANAMLLLNKILKKKLEERDDGDRVNVAAVYKNIELPLISVLVNMERNGITLDAESLGKFSKDIEIIIGRLQKEIYIAAGTEFNISSPKQLGEVLYNKLNIPVAKKTKSGQYSTNEKVLMENSVRYPVIAKILAFRELFKLQSTYTSALISQINRRTGRIHTTYNQTVVATGRLSSTNPNLQNIPTSTELGQEIRKMFTAGKGKMLVSFDYAQQELRLLAHFSQDEGLKKVFKEGKDIHSATAMKIFNLPENRVTKKERRVGKTVNFGVLYGMSPFGLADSLGISTEEARVFIEAFFAHYPKVQMYFDTVKKTAKLSGYVQSLYGREKDAGGLNSPNFPIRNRTVREIINFPLQASAADIIKLAMIKIDKLISEKYDGFAMLVLQVHDELIFEVKTADKNNKKLKDFTQEVREIMLEEKKLSVPMLVSVNTGKNWAELK